ncbi:MAG: uroporphyrinogen decarboxylase [Caldilineaceae bacterium]
MTNQTEPSSPFLRACRRLPTERPPIWLMRQAGRYMSEYRAIRAKHTMLEVIGTPELAAEVTLQPIRKFGFDAAIIFADILPPLIGMGIKLDFVKGEGPQIDNPLSNNDAIDRISTPLAEETMLAQTLAAISLVKKELEPLGVPLIGFAGAPFTLASYAVEGGSSKSYAKVKALMFREPAAWERLMNKLVTVQADYLLKQVKAGADALQIFDSWAGVLTQQDYLRYIQPYNKTLFAALKPAGVPVINFSTGTSALLPDVADCGGDVIGVDSQMPLDWCWQQIGHNRAIQGNLDPVALFAPWPELQARVDDILCRANGRPGHIFNLGHGILPDTPIENVQRLVDYVKNKIA